MAAKYILIADADQKTVVRIEEALEDLDVHVSVAADGAQALERALSVRQDLFVFGESLPVIDTPKLVEILRNNPRTAGVPIVLVREGGGAASFADAVLAKPVVKQQAVDAVLRFAFRISAVAEGGDRLAGSLSEIPMADLLQLIRANRREGMLEVQGEPTGTLWIRKGEVVDARAGKAEGMKAFLRLLERDSGRFVFKSARVGRAEAITLPLDALLLEGARQRDEVDRLRADRPLSGRLVLLRDLSALPQGLHPVHREILLLVEFYGSPEDIVENARVPDLEAHHALRSLLDAGLVGLSGSNPVLDAGLRIETSLAAFLKQAVRHTPRRPQTLRIPVFVSAAEVISGVQGVLPNAEWHQHQDRVLGNRILYPLDGDFTLQLDFYPPGRSYLALADVPVGTICGGLIVASAADDKELDFLNESARWLTAADRPVEYVFYGDAPAHAHWVRSAFGVASERDVHQVQRGNFATLPQAVRAVLTRFAVSAGWSVGVR